MSQPSQLTIQTLTVGYAKHVLLRDVSFDIAAGQRIALLGPSGCGKSTLLRAIVGLITPLEGRVLLNGKPPGAIGWPAYRRRVTLVAQQPALVDATVRDNLARAFAYSISDQRYDDARAAAYLEHVSLSSQLLDKPAQSLSVGQQLRVCLVRAALLQPGFLLLDEPTAALDADTRNAVGDFLRELQHGDRVGIVQVTHDRTAAADIADRVIELAAPANAEVST